LGEGVSASRLSDSQHLFQSFSAPLREHSPLGSTLPPKETAVAFALWLDARMLWEVVSRKGAKAQRRRQCQIK